MNAAALGKQVGHSHPDRARQRVARVRPSRHPPLRSRALAPSGLFVTHAFSVSPFAQVPFFLLPALGGVGVFVAVYVLSHQYDVSLRGDLLRGCLWA